MRRTGNANNIESVVLFVVVGFSRFVRFRYYRAFTAAPPRLFSLTGREGQFWYKNFVPFSIF